MHRSPEMTPRLLLLHRLLLLLLQSPPRIWCCHHSFLQIDSKEVSDNAHVIYFSRERSRETWKIIEEYLMPFVEKERYQLSSQCKLHPDNDLFRDQEQHKNRVDLNEWRCKYCKKSFYEEKYLDKHFDNRHYHLLNTIKELLSISVETNTNGCAWHVREVSCYGYS